MKTAHLHGVHGNTLRQSDYLGNQTFQSLPRIGEKILIPANNGFFVYQVIDSLHSFDPNVADENLFLRYIGTHDEYLDKHQT